MVKAQQKKYNKILKQEIYNSWADFHSKSRSSFVKAIKITIFYKYWSILYGKLIFLNSRNVFSILILILILYLLSKWTQYG